MLVPKFIQNLANSEEVRIKKLVHIFAENKQQDVYFFVGEHSCGCLLYRVFGDKSWSLRGSSVKYSEIIECLNDEVNKTIKAEYTNL